MLSKIIPWKILLQRAAHHYGFIDPVSFLARLRRFSQPSEVQEPMELLRAGVSFHARGLLNTKVIQNNLDWVWPYWIEKQFNPGDPSFIPRAFSFSHVNLTHRNWTAVGHPQLSIYPIVDPNGLITPLYDGWSIDLWLVGEDGEGMFPSKLNNVSQLMNTDQGLSVTTEADAIKSRVFLAFNEASEPELKIEVEVAPHQEMKKYLVASVRPYNPEGIQFVEDLELDSETGSNALLVNKLDRIVFSRQPKSVRFSNYENGDIAQQLGVPLASKETITQSVHCNVGMATAACLFEAGKINAEEKLILTVPLERELNREGDKVNLPIKDWDTIKNSLATLNIPDQKIQKLYDGSVATLMLLSAKLPVPGPYTYKRFWFRDACIMLNGLLVLNAKEKSREILNTFPSMQKSNGYFQSQQGEWDSNGQVLWIFDRFEQLTGELLSKEHIKSSQKAINWLAAKRMSEDIESLHMGLLPSGFSAEHFGPNDYYYWDDFWAISGLNGVTDQFQRHADHLEKNISNKDQKDRKQLEKEIFDLHSTAKKSRSIGLAFEKSVRKSLGNIPAERSQGGMPASPYRRLDSGAIGSMVADYPLQIFDANDPLVNKTLEFLLKHCFYKDAFFQDMIHSGINAYLTLAVAQTLLRNGDSRAQILIERVAELASPTGQWPEAIHPATGGGCMGDGQHGWAAAEWILMIRNLFVREERGKLIIGSGLFSRWLDTESTLFFGPTATPYGLVSVEITSEEGDRWISITGDWFEKDASIDVQVPGFKTFERSLGDFKVRMDTIS